MAGKKKAGANKVEMVREVIKQLGKDAMPLDIQRAIKDKHGVEMPTKLISNYKFHLHGKKKGNGRRKKGHKQAVTAPAVNSSGGAISVSDIEAVKSLVDRMGGKKVEQLAEVLGS